MRAVHSDVIAQIEIRVQLKYYVRLPLIMRLLLVFLERTHFMPGSALRSPLTLLLRSHLARAIFRTGFRVAFVAALLPQGACSNAQTLYVSDGTDTIFKVAPDGSKSTVATGLAKPTGLAFDASGNLYEANYRLGTIKRIALDGSINDFAGGFSSVQGIAFDASGNLYAADQIDNKVYKITPGGVKTVFATNNGLNAPGGLAFDSNGNLFVSNLRGKSISKITPDGTVSTFYTSTDLNVPEGLVFASNGNLLVTHFDAASAYPILSSIAPNGVSSDIISGQFHPEWFHFANMAFDTNGDLYIANNGKDNVLKVSNNVVSVFTTITNADFLAFAPRASAAATPEPGSVALLITGGVTGATILRRRKRAYKTA